MVKSNFTYEDAYALRIKEFEKEQVRLNRRPPLPTWAKYTNTAPAAEALRKQQIETRKNVFKSVLANIAQGEAIDARTLAGRIGTTSQKLTNYMKPMVEEGYLNRFNMANNKGVVAYVYLPTGKELEE